MKMTLNSIGYRRLNSLCFSISYTHSRGFDSRMWSWKISGPSPIFNRSLSITFSRTNNPYIRSILFGVK